MYINKNSNKNIKDLILIFKKSKIDLYIIKIAVKMIEISVWLNESTFVFCIKLKMDVTTLEI